MSSSPGAATMPAPTGPAWWQHPGRADVLIVIVLGAIAVPPLTHGHVDWRAAVLDVLLLAPLLVRRRYPTGVFALVALAALVQWFCGLMLSADASLLIALYTIAVGRGWRAALPAVAVLEVGVVLASLRFVPAGRSALGSMVFLSGLVAAALFLATTVRARAELVADLQDRARRAERERDQQAALAATAERARIAREMHDIIAHSLSVIITLADGAAAAQSADPQAANAAIRQVSITGRQSLAEMRRLLGVLRDPASAQQDPPEPAAGPLAPQPTLHGLDALLDDFRATGLPVELTTTGRVPEVPDTAQATVYRIVQEGLTNVLKHARRPGRARVALVWSPGLVDVTVVDDGRAAPAPRLTPPWGLRPGQSTTDVVRPGHGLQGMRERVRLFDGEVEAGPLAAGGWSVHARLRLDGGAPDRGMSDRGVSDRGLSDPGTVGGATG